MRRDEHRSRSPTRWSVEISNSFRFSSELSKSFIRQCIDRIGFVRTILVITDVTCREISETVEHREAVVQFFDIDFHLAALLLVHQRAFLQLFDRLQF